MKLYKQYSPLFNSWTFFIKKGTKWYTYMCGTDFTKMIWPEQFDKWIEAWDSQDSFAEYGIISPSHKLEFLLLTGRDLEESTKNLVEGTEREEKNSSHWTLGSYCQWTIKEIDFHEMY